MWSFCSSIRSCTNAFNFCKNACITYSKMRMTTNAARVPSSSFKTTLKLSALGLGVGTIVGTGYSIHLKNKPYDHIPNEETAIKILQDIPTIEPTRKIKVVGDQTGLKLTLYQYENCPFCSKVRAFLDYYGISYNVVEVDPVLRQSVKWSEYKKVPILVAKVKDGYQPLNDSSMIVSALASYLQNSERDLTNIVKSYPLIKYSDENGAVKNDVMNKYFLMLDEREMNVLHEASVKEERQWRKWTDDVLVHTLSPNVYRTWAESLQTFNWFSDKGEWDKHFPAWEKYIMIYIGAAAMLVIGKRLKKRHHLKEDVRQSLYDECNYFIRAVNSKGTQFMGGNLPNLADLAVYGILNSIEGCNAFQDLLNHTKIKKWYFSMKDAVTNHRGGAFTELAVHK